MGNGLVPLHYAIIEHFVGECEDCAAGVVEALAPDYGGYKMLTLRDVEEALATAKENGILDETRCVLGEQGDVVVYYRISDFGKGMVERYLM